MSLQQSYLPRSVAVRLAKEVKDLLNSRDNSDNVDNHSTFRLLVDEATGMPHSLSELEVELEGPTGTPYANKYFLLRFTFGADFPATPPTAHFLTKVYHPNIDMTNGKICVNTLKKDWKPNHTISHILSVIRCLLIVPFPESSLNEDAGKLFMESYNEYFKRAKLHADVHGKQREGGCRPNSNNSSSSEDGRVLQAASDNQSKASSNSGTGNSCSDITKKKCHDASKGLARKKSLKRL